MMMGLLVFKAKCKEIFEKHYKVLRAMLKILVSAGVFSVILYQLPFQEGLNYYAVPVVILLALFCGFIPDIAVMCVAALLVLAETAAVSMVCAFAIFAALAVYFLLFGRYTRVQSYLVLLIPILWEINLSYAVPVIAALFLTPAMIPACGMGILLHYLLLGVREYHMISQNAVDTGNTMEGLQYMIDHVLNNREMIVYLCTFSVAYLLVFIIRKGRYNHASQIGIFVGIIACMAGILAGDIFWQVSADVNQLLTGLSITAVAAYVVQFFRMSLDYTGVRKLQFEDDEYFYYVKAVPKLKVAVVDKTVTKIDDRDEAVIDLKNEIEKVLGEDINPDKK